MKLIPASSARWMIRIESSWSVLPQAPNIIAPRQSGLTCTPVLPSVRYSIPRTYPSLVVEQLALHFQATCVARQLAGGADDPVARDDDGDRVDGVRVPDRAGDAAELARELAVGDGLAVGDLDERVPHALLELGAARRELQVELLAVAREVLVELGRHVGERAVVRPGLGVEAVSVGVQARQAALVALDEDRADRAGEECGVHAHRTPWTPLV